MQCVYLPRHLLDTPSRNEHHAGADTDIGAPRWLVGWRMDGSGSSSRRIGVGHPSPVNDLDVCVATCVQAQPSALSSLLSDLSSHPALQSLWSHTSGALQLLGVMHSSDDSVGGSQFAHPLALRVGWVELLRDQTTRMPVVLPLHGGVRAAQVVLFDAPSTSADGSSAPRFFDTSSPFASAGSAPTACAEDDAALAGPLGPAGSGSDGAVVSPVSPSPLEVALRRINSCAPTEAIIKHFLRQRELARPFARGLERDEDDDGALRVASHPPIPADFPFTAVAATASLPSRAYTLLTTPFRWILWLLFQLLFFACDSLLSPLLRLRVLSLSRLVSSLFAPGMARRVHIEFVPLWQASYALGAMHDKIEQARRARRLHEALGRQRTRLLGVATRASVRAEEELWGGTLCHALDVLLGAAVGVLMLALLGCFDGAVLPAEMRPWVPSVLLDSASLRSCFSIPTPLLDLGASVSASFESLLSSSAPAGFKLNHRLHDQLGRLLRQGVADYVALVRGAVRDVSESPLAALVLRRSLQALACLCAVHGVSLLLSCLLDAVWWLSLPLVLLHATVARICSFTCSIFSSLLLLFRGQKRNVLRRGRLDSFPTSANYEHMALGTIGLACTTFLAPTVIVWHAIATSARILARDLPVLVLHAARGALQSAPCHLAALWMRDRLDSGSGGERAGGQRIPAGVWLEVLETRGLPTAPPVEIDTTYLLLHASPAPATTLLFRTAAALRLVVRSNPPARLLRTLVWGSDYTNTRTTSPSCNS